MTNAARIYGNSLYDLAQEEGCVEPLAEQLQQIRTLFAENPEYVRLLQEPTIEAEKRRELMEEAFSGAEKYLLNFLKLLCDRNLLREYAGCCDQFMDRFREDRGIAVARVTSAVPLDEAQLTALRDKLEKISDRTVEIKTVTDPSVMGGIRVELNGKLLDGTVKGRLDGISRKLEEVTV